MGRTEAAYAEADFRKHLLGALEWTAGLVRGDCKATINANYRGTKLISAGPTATGLATSGESHGLTIADNGWVMYIGRGDCRTDAERGGLIGLPSLGRILDHANPNVGIGCGSVHIFDPAQYTGAENSGVTRAGTLAVYGDGGQGGERTNEDNHKMEYGLLGITADPNFSDQRPRLHAVLPDLQPAELPARPGRGPADLEDVAAAHLALHDRPHDQAARPELGADHLRVRRPDLLLLPRRRRHGLRLRGQPLRHHR